MYTSFSNMTGDLKSSTRSRTGGLEKKFRPIGIKDANACLYWVKRLVEASTDDASSNDQMVSDPNFAQQGELKCHFPPASPPAPGPSTPRTAKSGLPYATR